MNTYFSIGIPVIIMGETGCGKTKLIDFMSKLQVPNELDIQTMITLKVSISQIVVYLAWSVAGKAYAVCWHSNQAM